MGMRLYILKVGGYAYAFIIITSKERSAVLICNENQIDAIGIGKDKIMKMTYDGTMVLPNNYVVVDQNEMEYVEGGIGVPGAIAMITSLVAAGYATTNIGKECGAYVYNNGGSRKGVMMMAFKLAGIVLAPFNFLYDIGLDNGWVNASNQ